MKYFKDSKGSVFAYASDGSQDEFIPEGMAPISKAAAMAIASPTPPDSELATAARSKRDRLLSESDWVVTRSIEAATSVPPDWIAYRQALRDVPEQAGFPGNVLWPNEPI